MVVNDYWYICKIAKDGSQYFLYEDEDIFIEKIVEYGLDNCRIFDTKKDANSYIEKLKQKNLIHSSNKIYIVQETVDYKYDEIKNI